MRIFICCSKHFYARIPPVKDALELAGHAVLLPNSYEAPFKEEEMKALGEEAHRKWKAEMIRKHDPNIRACDAILVLNFAKGNFENYIGGATFLEVHKAFELGRPIFFLNPLPECIFTDELRAMGITMLDGDLSKIPNAKQ